MPTLAKWEIENTMACNNALVCVLWILKQAKEKVGHVKEGRSIHNPPSYREWNTSPPQLWNRINYPPNFSEPDKSPPEVVWNSGFATVTVVWIFSFFISVETLKNHNKSQKNHKIENPILLDSTWVDANVAVNGRVGRLHGVTQWSTVLAV
jgi:hypothetical protein